MNLSFLLLLERLHRGNKSKLWSCRSVLTLASLSPQSWPCRCSCWVFIVRISSLLLLTWPSWFNLLFIVLCPRIMEFAFISTDLLMAEAESEAVNSPHDETRCHVWWQSSFMSRIWKRLSLLLELPGSHETWFRQPFFCLTLRHRKSVFINWHAAVSPWLTQRSLNAGMLICFLFHWGVLAPVSHWSEVICSVDVNHTGPLILLLIFQLSSLFHKSSARLSKNFSIDPSVASWSQRTLLTAVDVRLFANSLIPLFTRGSGL